MKRINRMTAIAATLLLAASSAWATNGYFQHGYGPEHKALAGAGAAYAITSLSTIINPAAATEIGNHYDFALDVFSPQVSYTVNGNPSGQPNTFGLTPGKVESDANFFLIPAFGYNRALDEKSAVGMVLYGNGGMTTDYPTTTFYAPEAPTGVNLMQAFAQITYARKITPNHSVGISGVLAGQSFSADGLVAFSGYSTDANNLTNRGTSTSVGYGARVGYQGQVLPVLRIGASYQTKMLMSEFDEYKGLFAESGDFDIPATWTAGVAVNAGEKLVLLADVQQILYSGVKAVSNPFDPTAFGQGVFLGADEGAGFGWDDMTVLKLGAEYGVSEQLAVRCGYSYGTQPVPGDGAMINILAPGVIQQHITLGGTYHRSNNQAISFSFGYALSNTVTGPNVMEMPNQQTIDLDMAQFDFEIGFTLD